MALAYAEKLGSNAPSGSGTTVVITTTAAAAVGSHIIVAAGREVDVTMTVADSAGNTYQEDRYLGGTSGLALFSARVTTELGIGGTITVTFSATSTNRIAGAYEITDAAASSWRDQANSNTNASGTSHNTGAITTTAAASIVFAALYFADNEPDITVTADAAYTQVDKLSGPARCLLVQYRLLAATGTHTPTATTGTNITSRGVVANYKEVVAATGHTANNLLLLGAG